MIIEAVTVQRGLALWQAGPVRYASQGQDQPITKPHLLRHVRLGPGQDVLVGIPVRTWSCVSKGTWASVPFAYVTERFGPFTHRVPIPWGMQDDRLVLHFPGGAQDTFCASQRHDAGPLITVLDHAIELSPGPARAEVTHVHRGSGWRAPGSTARAWPGFCAEPGSRSSR